MFPDSLKTTDGLTLRYAAVAPTKSAEHYPDGPDGIVVIAPAVVASGVPPLVKLLVPVLSRLAPRASINPGLDLTHISRDAAAVREYTRDPLFQTRTTPRLAAEILSTMNETREMADRLTRPLLIGHGADDTIVPPRAVPTSSGRWHRRTRNGLFTRMHTIIC